MTTTVLIIICGATFALTLYVLYCRVRNRKYFLNNLHENQIVRYGEEERIGRIVSVYTSSVLVCDMKTLKSQQVELDDISPL